MWKKTIFVASIGIGLSIWLGPISPEFLKRIGITVSSPPKAELKSESSKPDVKYSSTKTDSTSSTDKTATSDGSKLFTADELKLYNGVDNMELYISILGNVFDVTKGAKHYGPNKQYYVFVGTDSSRSFVTGKFKKEDASDKVEDLEPKQLLSLQNWLKFYKKDYIQVGKLVGTYYDQSGNATPYNKQVKKLMDAAGQSKDKEEVEKKKYPPCNMEWDEERGTRVWCTDASGGIQRDWIGVPRKLFKADTKDFRCACVQDPKKNSEIIREYDGCDKNAQSCYVKV